MGIRFYQYPGCSTCRKAAKWLRAREVTFETTHIVESPPDMAALRSMWERSGLPLRRFFNTNGQSYRQGGFKDRIGAMSDNEQLRALAADGKLIKRPLLDLGDTVLVGFREAAWAPLLGG